MAEYSTTEVHGISGASERQLQWWHEHAVVRPRMVGKTPHWSEENTLEVCIAADLRNKGFSLKAIGRVLDYFRRRRRGADVPEYLVIEGARHIRQARLQRANVHLEYGRDDAFVRIANSKGGVFLVDLDELCMRIADWQRAKDELKQRAAERLARRQIGSAAPERPAARTSAPSRV